MTTLVSQCATPATNTDEQCGTGNAKGILATPVPGAPTAASPILAVVGSRHCVDRERVFALIDAWIAANGRPAQIVSGGASGVDAAAELYAQQHCISLQVMRAEWARFGRRAGPRRNALIVEAATHVLALPSRTGRGTQDTIAKARAVGKPCQVQYID